ncbi:MAG TPA: DUF3459 domain-containing protein [Chloroflexi bacterium]|nr:DUF3459 domain-containing protein [Chloroflexota bacterium]
MTLPYWLPDAVFYQIFPDRFANGDPDNDPPNVALWGSQPTIWNFMGGDLRGILQHLDYLLDLGVNALYFNPIFHATSNHRYNTTDYYRIDPKLGTLADFHALLETCHANGIRVILDGVFNHTGRGFFAFNDILENGEHSPYKDWYLIHRFPVQAYGEGKAEDYEAWWGFRSLPKLNTTNPQVREFIFDVARYWLKQGIDGWRLDVPNEIDDDAFWQEFRHVVKTANPDACLVGEIWTADARWVQHFDGLMHYPLREAILGFVEGSLAAPAFASRLQEFLTLYGEHARGMYLPLGSHDTERLMTVLGGDEEKVRLALGLQFAYPGAPAVYYGDEIGLEGGKDPDNRRAFPWDEAQWRQGVRTWVQRLIAVRKRIPALRRGDFRLVEAKDGRQCVAFGRVLGAEAVLVVANASSVKRHCHLPVAALGWEDGRIVHDLLGHGEGVVAGDTLHWDILPRQVVWLA